MQIKAHVPELTNLYIAQVKRKYGLDVGYNYNLTKKKTPKCQNHRKKEAAIMEGLKYFQMI